MTFSMLLYFLTIEGRFKNYTEHQTWDGICLRVCFILDTKGKVSEANDTFSSPAWATKEQ